MNTGIIPATQASFPPTNQAHVYKLLRCWHLTDKYLRIVLGTPVIRGPKPNQTKPNQTKLKTKPSTKYSRQAYLVVLRTASVFCNSMGRLSTSFLLDERLHAQHSTRIKINMSITPPKTPRNQGWIIKSLTCSIVDFFSLMNGDGNKILFSGLL